MVEAPIFRRVVVLKGNRARTVLVISPKAAKWRSTARLDQRSWEAQDGSRRSKVEIVADTVMFIGGQGRDPPRANSSPAAACNRCCGAGRFS